MSISSLVSIFFFFHVLLLLLILSGFALFHYFGDDLTLTGLARREVQLRELQAREPALVFGAAALIYVGVTGMSLPGAAALTLVFAWYFGLIGSLTSADGSLFCSRKRFTR